MVEERAVDGRCTCIRVASVIYYKLYIHLWQLCNVVHN